MAWPRLLLSVLTLVAAVGGCDDPPCARQPPVPDALCAPGGLAGVELAGTWTVTGTETTTIWRESTTSTAIARPVTIDLAGDSWCEPESSLIPNAYVFADDTQVVRNSYDGYHNRFDFTICRRASDGALLYRSEWHGYPTDKETTYDVEGVLSK